MTQATLRTDRLTLLPLADEHLEHEVELDADPAVMRYLGAGRARTRAEVEELHARRLATGQLVPGLGFWVRPAGGGGRRVVAPAAAGAPRPGPGRGAGRAGRRWPPSGCGTSGLHEEVDVRIPGAELGEVEYAITQQQWRAGGPVR